MGSKRARLQTFRELIEHASQNERQRLEQRHGIFQFRRFLKFKSRLHRNQRTRSPPACQRLQTKAFLSQTLRKLRAGQYCQSAERAHTPAVECFENFELRSKHLQRQAAQQFGLFTFGYHADAAKPAPCMDGGVDVGGHGDIRFESQRRSASFQIARDGFRRAEKVFESCQIEHHRVRRRRLNTGREGKAKIEKSSVRRLLLRGGALPDCHLRKLRRLKLTDAWFNSPSSRLVIERDYPAERRLAVGNCHCFGTQGRLGAQNGLY